jgi:hypothetical protein
MLKAVLLKKRTKELFICSVAVSKAGSHKAKVFCFFFSKKKRLLAVHDSFQNVCDRIRRLPH